MLRVVTAQKIAVSFALGAIFVMLTGFLSSHSAVGTPVPLPGGHVWSFGYPLAWYKTPMGIPGVTVEVPLHPLLGSMEYLHVSNLAIDFLFWFCISFLLTMFRSHFRGRHAPQPKLV